MNKVILVSCMRGENADDPNETQDDSKTGKNTNCKDQYDFKNF